MTDDTLKGLAAVLCKADNLETDEITDYDADDGQAIIRTSRPFAGDGICSLRARLREEALERRLYAVAAQLSGR